MYYYGLSDSAFWAAVAVGQVAFWVAMSPLIKAFAARVRSPGVVAEGLEARVAALEAGRPITGEADAVRHQVLELEERLDFTERLLAQQREQARLPH